ncbi:MAG: PP2C family protein-serine/threonine phosphatase, partial [Candidatus Woesearchaeota archaeon]
MTEYDFQHFSESKIKRRISLGAEMPEWYFTNELLNKDAFLIDTDCLAAVIADGVNSVNQGGRASGLVSMSILTSFKEYYQLLRSKVGVDIEIEDLVRTALQNANAEMLSLFDSFPEYGFLATTVDACFIHDDIAHIGHVGDSRVYYLAHDSDALEQLTTDHSVLPANFRGLTEDKKFIVEVRAMLANYVGGNEMYPDYVSRAMSPGDIIFMATDGVIKCLKPETICNSLRQSMQRS